MATSTTAGRKAVARERELRALELRKTGAGYQAIAKQLGISVGAAHKAVTRALARLESDVDVEARDLRKLELERLDRALLAIWSQVLAGHLGAVDRLIRLSELRAKYLQINGLERAENMADIDRWLQHLTGAEK